MTVRSTRNALHFLNLLFGGLYAGFLVGVLFIELALRRYGGEIYTLVEQVKHTYLDDVAIATLAPTMVTGTLLVLLLWRRRDWPFFLALIGLLCFATALAATFIVNVPINAEQMTWDSKAPPADWAEVRDRWQAAHILRTVVSVGGLCCFILTAVLPATSEPCPKRPLHQAAQVYVSHRPD